MYQHEVVFLISDEPLLFTMSVVINQIHIFVIMYGRFYQFDVCDHNVLCRCSALYYIASRILKGTFDRLN